MQLQWPPHKGVDLQSFHMRKKRDKYLKGKTWRKGRNDDIGWKEVPVGFFKDTTDEPHCAGS